MSTERRIKFLSRNLPFPTNMTFREYRAVQELTGVTADQMLTGSAGVWILPAVAIVALMRDNKNVTFEQLQGIIDLSPADISVEGGEEEDPQIAPETTAGASAEKSTGTESTLETLERSGDPSSPITSPEPQPSPTT